MNLTPRPAASLSHSNESKDPEKALAMVRLSRPIS